MSYKDPEKQKEANKEASQRRRDKVKGMTQGMTGIDLPPLVLANIIATAKRYGHLKERIRKALEYQEWSKPRPGVLKVTA